MLTLNGPNPLGLHTARCTTSQKNGPTTPGHAPSLLPVPSGARASAGPAWPSRPPAASHRPPAGGSPPAGCLLPTQVPLASPSWDNVQFQAQTGFLHVSHWGARWLQGTALHGLGVRSRLRPRPGGGRSQGLSVEKQPEEYISPSQFMRLSRRGDLNSKRPASHHTTLFPYRVLLPSALLCDEPASPQYSLHSNCRRGHRV